MPRASSTSASTPAFTPYSIPSTQDNTNTIEYKVNCYLGVIHRSSWPTSLKEALKDSCFDSDDGEYHCPEDNCESTFDGKRACDFFRHLASFKKHGDMYPYGPVYYCRGTVEGGVPCPFNSTQQSNAKEHIKCVHLKIKTPCPFCPEEFPDAASKSRHVKAMHRKPKSATSGSTSASPSPSPDASRTNKRKSEELDAAEPPVPHRAQKRSREVSFTMKNPVVKPEPLETPLCHSASTLSDANQFPFTFVHPYLSLSAQETYLNPTCILEPTPSSSDVVSTSTTPLDLEPSHNPAWNWTSFDTTGISPLSQPATTPAAVFPIVPQATIYTEDPNSFVVQQTADLFDALYDPNYLTQPFYEPSFDLMTMYSVESTYRWDFNTIPTLEQPLTCAPGEYFL